MGNLSRQDPEVYGTLLVIRVGNLSRQDPEVYGTLLVIRVGNLSRQDPVNEWGTSLGRILRFMEPS